MALQAMVLNSRRCIVDDVSSVSSVSSYSRSGAEEEGSSDAGYSSSSRSSASQRSESARSGSRRSSAASDGACSGKSSQASAMVERPSSARPARRQRRTVEKGKRPSSAPFIAKAGAVNRSGVAVTLRITTNEQIREKRRRKVLKQDVLRKKVAVALISFEWRCFWRGRHRRQKAAVTVLQRIARGRRVRRGVLEELSAVAIQFHARRFLRRMAKIRAELLTLATLRLQRAFLSRQRRRCRVLQSLAADCATAAKKRVERLEQEEWLATQKRRQLAERKHAETVKAALTDEVEQKAARKAYGGTEHGKEDLQALKERLQKEEAAASLIRRVFLKRMMRRRVRVLVHEQRQNKIAELASDVSCYIDAALIVAHKADSAGRSQPARARSAPPISVVAADRGASRLSSCRTHRRQGSRSAPPTRENSLVPLDSIDESIVQTQLRAAGQIYGTSAASNPRWKQGDVTSFDLTAQNQHDQNTESFIGHNLSRGLGSHRNRPTSGTRDQEDVGSHDYFLDAAGRHVRAEVRLAARSLSAQEASKERPDKHRGYLSQGSDGTPEQWLPRVNAPASKSSRSRRSSVAGGQRAARTSRAGSRHRLRASARPHSAAY